MYADTFRDDFIMVPDNAHPQTAEVAMISLENEYIIVMDRPVMASDLKQTEPPLRDMLSGCVRRTPHLRENVQNLTNALVYEWQVIILVVL